MYGCGTGGVTSLLVSIRQLAGGGAEMPYVIKSPHAVVGIEMLNIDSRGGRIMNHNSRSLPT